ncbi:Sulphur transport domain-containing protein [Bordetella sputigena]|uniref:YeeE/YedE family protein n=1 Tax=Bordetella sputigena TaxID=1416810 RepID=UPI0039EF29CA
MTIDTIHFTPGWSLLGGLVIGTAIALLLLLNGRVAGISGILGGLPKRPRGDTLWRLMFVIGLVGAPLIMRLAGAMPVAEISAGWPTLCCAGFLVGIGTRYANGCTSGHGVCGLSRGSLRSVVATLTFMAFAFATVFVNRHLLGG